MACADVATAKAKATAINLIISFSPLRTFNLEEWINSAAKGVQSVGTDRTPEALFSRACREGKTGTKAVTSSARRGALAMIDVAACTNYHITRANVNITSCDTMAQNRRPRTSNDRLRRQRTVPLRFVCGHRRSGRQLQHCGMLTLAQLRQ